MTQERRELLESAVDAVTRTFVCDVCKEKVDVIGSTLQWKQLDDDDGLSIQDIFPELGNDIHNLMVGGMCDSCFDKMFEQEQVEYETLTEGDGTNG